MSYLAFQNRNNVTKANTVNNPEVQALLALAQQKGLESGALKQLEEFKPKKSILLRGLEILQTGEFFVGGLISGKGPIEGIKQKISPSEALGISRKHKSFKEAAKDPSSYLGLALDIFLDPITYITFGYGAGVKLSTKVGTKVLNKSGKKLLRETTERVTAKAGRNVSKEVLNAEAKKIVARQILTKKGVEKYINKGGLKFFGQEVLPRTTITKPLSMVGYSVSKVPGVKEAVKTFKTAFKPFHKIKVLPENMGDKYISSFNLLQKGTRAQDAKFVKLVSDLKVKTPDLQKLVGNRKVEDVIAESLQTGVMTGIREVDAVIKGLADFNRRFLKEEFTRGLKVGKVPNYLRRFLTEDGRKFMEAGGNLDVALTKPLRVKAGFAKKRRFLKLIDEKGNEVIESTKFLSLEKVNKNKLIEQITKQSGKEIGALQEAIKKLAKPEITKEFKDIKDLIVKIKKQLLPDFSGVSKEVIDKTDVDEDLFKKALANVIGPQRRELETVLKEYETLLKADVGKEFLSKPLKAQKIIKNARQKKIIELNDKILKIQNDALGKIREIEAYDFIGPTGMRYRYSQIPLTIQEINDKMSPLMEQVLGKKNAKFFEPDPFKAVAGRGAESIKAIRTMEWFSDVAKQFGKIPKFDDAGRPIREIIDGVQYVESSAPQLKGVLLPKPIVKHIDDINKFMNDDEVANAFLKVYDKILKIWKGSVTSWFPSFHTRNFIGGTFNNWLAGMRNPRLYKIGDDIAREKIGKIKTEIGTEYNYHEIRKLIKQYGVSGQPGIIDVFEETKKLAKPGMLNKIPGGGRLAMGFVEDRLRIPLFVDRLIKGDSPEFAAKKVFRYHFDYAPEGLTAFERSSLRRLIPFYRWARGNIPLQIEQMVKQPGKYAGFKKFIDQIQDTDKLREEYGDLPEYMQENLPIRISEKQGVGQYLYGLGLPVEDINRLWRGSAKRTLEGVLSELSPPLKFPIEKGTGVNLYFGTKIKDYTRAPNFLKVLPKPLKEWLNYHKITRTDGTEKLVMDPDKLHTLQALLSRGWITADKLTDARTVNAVKVMYGLVGLKARAVDTEIQKYYNNRDRIRALEDYLRRMGEGRIFRQFYVPKD